jgi:hypothetical protein
VRAAAIVARSARPWAWPRADLRTGVEDAGGEPRSSSTAEVPRTVEASAEQPKARPERAALEST